ncbi:HEAT repeat domain-containing protein [Calothrix sp. PCC 6303]|uniref:HEAT repeat domain-containing protein n=1 Tax=Calothrix sp. PCC 6303 TaxID=1170562 RepID=UPI0002A00C0F|nr:HEAT repeat domain-containing protein [Calothrix sp. PCC 6303]AFZ00964.1 HEAT domain containing protein [Calothrix sp. PCC 6303]
MNSRIYFIVSLLTVITFVPDNRPVAAEKVKINLPPGIPAIADNQVNTKVINVTQLVEKLRTADVEERRKIIEQLSGTQENIVPALVQAMEDPDPLVKSAVAEVLGNLTDAAVPAIPALIEMMKSGQRAIVPSSYLISPYGYPVIASLPASGNTEERRIPSTPPENPENLLRITAIASLGKIGLPARISATPPLIQALQDPDPWVKLNATWALSEIGASTPLLAYWLEALQSSDPKLRNSAAEIFQDSRSLLRKVFGSEADANTAIPLLVALKDEDVTVRDVAGKGLELLGTKAIPGLIQGLKAPEPIVRLEAAKLLGNLGVTAQSAVPNLVVLLGDSGRYVPPNTNRNGLFLSSLPPLAIPYTPGRRQYPPAPDNPDKLVRINAAIALGKVGDRKAISALTNALKDNNPWMQLSTAWALLKLGQNQGLPVVGRLVQHPNSSIQREALSQIKGYGSQGATYLLPYYGAQLDSRDENKRNNAIIEIGQLGVRALDLVPKLRVILVGKQKNSSGYAATILGQIALDTAVAGQTGNLSPKQRKQAIAQFNKVLQIMEAPNARFNTQPRDRIRNALTRLRSIT